MSLFNRVLNLSIETAAGETVLLFDESFKISFSVFKNSSSNPNSATIKIYNLSINTKNVLKDVFKKNQQLSDDEKPPLHIYLSAGYGDDVGATLIFSGNITDVYTMYQEPDYITNISCYDGGVTLRDTFLNIAYQNGIDSNVIIKQIANAMKTSIDSASVYLDKNFKLANGISLSGKAKDLMDNITQRGGLQWTIENNKIRIAPQGLATNEPAIVLASDTGLIGSPQRLQTAGFDAMNTNVVDEYKCKTLLLTGVAIFRLVEFRTKDVTGFYAIRSAQHTGDTYGSAWTTDLDVIDPKFLV